MRIADQDPNNKRTLKLERTSHFPQDFWNSPGLRTGELRAWVLQAAPNFRQESDTPAELCADRVMSPANSGLPIQKTGC